jgi:hypothetical protein
MKKFQSVFHELLAPAVAVATGVPVPAPALLTLISLAPGLAAVNFIFPALMMILAAFAMRPRSIALSHYIHPLHISRCIITHMSIII